MTFLSDTFKGVPDSTICEWYYYLFLVNAGLFSLLIISLIVLMFVDNKAFMKMIGGNFLIPIVTSLIGLTSGLFFYLMCDRTLLKN
jgi:LytS/YehU family sensor histidine kinase